VAGAAELDELLGAGALDELDALEEFEVAVAGDPELFEAQPDSAKAPAAASPISAGIREGRDAEVRCLTPLRYATAPDSPESARLRHSYLLS
jgi:hypothetical protein